MERRNSIPTLTAVTTALAALGFSGAVAATKLSGTLHVDNSFEVYVSDSNTELGTSLLSGNSWPTAYSFSRTLTGGTKYLHIEAVDWGPPGAFIGQFSLDDTDFRFANTTQTLLTNTTDWTVRIGGLNGTVGTVSSSGKNGVGPWGMRPDVSANADWIWTSGESACTAYPCTRYFSTTITAAVPEPGTYALMSIGLGFVVAAAIRKRRIAAA